MSKTTKELENDIVFWKDKYKFYFREYELLKNVKVERLKYLLTEVEYYVESHNMDKNYFKLKEEIELICASIYRIK